MSAAAPTADVPPGRLTVPLPTGPLLGLLGVFALFVILIGLKGELASFLSFGNLQILLHEATITEDPLHLMRVFGVSAATAMRYLHAAHPERGAVPPR